MKGLNPLFKPILHVFISNRCYILLPHTQYYNSYIQYRDLLSLKESQQIVSLSLSCLIYIIVSTISLIIRQGITQVHVKITPTLSQGRM